MLRSTLALFLVSICFSSSVAQKSAAQSKTRIPRETIAISFHEGTNLSFDLSPDGHSIVFDLLGQLWLTPVSGGAARAITDGVRDTAEDLDPSFSPDGRQVVFRAERNGRTGLWLLNLDSGRLRQLTQLSNPEGYDGSAAWSPDGRVIAFARLAPPDSASRRPGRIMLLDIDSGNMRELPLTGISGPAVSDPVWRSGGKEIAFVASFPQRGGRIWSVSVAGGQAKPLTADSVHALAPAFSSDDHFMAYLASDEADRTQVWVQEFGGNGATTGSPIRVTNHVDVTATRVRWFRDGRTLLYSADGRLWKVAATGGTPTEIGFTAQLSFTRPR